MRRCIDWTDPIATACMRLGTVEGCIVLLLVHLLMRLRRRTSTPVASASLQYIISMQRVHACAFSDATRAS